MGIEAKNLVNSYYEELLNAIKINKSKYILCNNINIQMITEKENFAIGNFSFNKALSHDLISNIVLKSEKNDNVFENSRIDFIKNSIQKLLNNKNIDHIVGRMFFLNKVWPNTPTCKQLRPITIMSPIKKIIENSLVNRLKEYVSKKIIKSQTGFVPFLGTEINLFRLCELNKELKEQKKSKFCGFLFIDLSNAFDSIPTNKIIEICKIENILDFNEQLILEFILNNNLVEINNKI